jgi:hypothetical protein
MDLSQDVRLVYFMYQKANSVTQWLTVGSSVLQNPPVAHLPTHGAPKVVTVSQEPAAVSYPEPVEPNLHGATIRIFLT